MSDLHKILFNMAPGVPQEFKYFDKPQETTTPDGKRILWKEALIVEEGVFNKHAITEVEILNFVRNFSRPLPMQVNHDRDPYKTVGRLWEVKALQVDGGWKLFGLFKVIDTDAQERIIDGRWMELSIGFYFKPEHRLYECSVVTDPACITAHMFKKTKEVSAMGDDIDKEKEKETPPAPEAEALMEDEEEYEEDEETTVPSPSADSEEDDEEEDEESLSQDSDEVARLKAELAEKDEKLAESEAERAKFEVDAALAKLNADRYITPAQMPVAKEICLAMDAELRGKMFSFIALGMKQWKEGRLTSDEVKPTAAGSSDDADYEKLSAIREKRKKRRAKTTS